MESKKLYELITAGDGCNLDDFGRIKRWVFTPMQFTPNFCYWNDKDFNNVKDKSQLRCISVCAVENDFLREGEEVDIIYENPGY